MSNRRSSRIHTVPAATASGSTSIYAEDDDDYEEDQEVTISSTTTKKPSGTAKKRKAARNANHGDEPRILKKPRGKRGMLQQLTEMPMDVLFEIFGQLNPIDVLHLARTTKTLRGILMNHSSISIWKQACSNISGLPPCPDDLQPPQWVNLVFGKSCHFCLKTHSAQTIAWEARLRSCTKCIMDEFTPRSRDYDNIVGIPSDAVGLLPVVTVRTGRRSREETMRYTKVRDAWRDEYKKLQQPEEKVAWLAEKREQRLILMQHVNLCKAWAKKQTVERCQEQEGIRTQRKADICRKLEELGWGEEISLMPNADAFLNCSLITNTSKKDFTERVWANIKDGLVTRLTEIKAARLETERKAALKKRHVVIQSIHKEYVAGCSPDSILLPPCEIYLAPEFRDIADNTPIDDEVTEESFETAKLTLPEINCKWRDETNQKLLTMMGKSLSTDEGATNLIEGTLNLATSIFCCTQCAAGFLLYPRVLIHRCATHSPAWRMGRTPCEPHVELFCRNTDAGPWNLLNAIKYQPQSSKAASEIVKLAGLDPAKTTVEEMDVLDPIYECITCLDPRLGRYMMNWKMAASHKYSDYRADANHHQFELSDEATQAIIRVRLEEDLRRKRASSNYNGLCCVHCRERDSSIGLRTHLQTQHGISNPSDNDIQRHADADHDLMSYRYWSPQGKWW